MVDGVALYAGLALRALRWPEPCVRVSLRDLGMALRSRELSAVEHVTDALDRLAADPYNTVITLDADRALARAAALDAELAAGRWRGPLHGVAVGVKDLIDVAGLPTRCGSLVRPIAGARQRPTRPSWRGCSKPARWWWRSCTRTSSPTAPPVTSPRPARPQPARPVPDHRRVVVRLGGGGRGRAPAAGARHRHRGERAHARRAVRGGRAEAARTAHLSAEGAFPLSESLRHGRAAHRRRALGVGGVGRARRPDGTGGGIQQPGVKGVRVGVPTDAYWQPARPVDRARSSRPRWNGCGARGRRSSRWPRR